MKKKFIFAIFGISLLLVACQEDSYYNDDMIGKNSSILTETMKLIEDNHSFVSLPNLDKTIKGSSATRSGSSKSLRYEEEDFIFDWGEADVMTSKLAEAVIVPVKYNKEIALRSITLEGNSRRKETTPLYSILYMRKMLKTGQTHAHILSFAPDREYVNACEESGEELQLFPNPQGSNFSGILFFSTIYGEITHGIRYENGRKCYYIMPRSERNRDFIEQYRHGHDCAHECDSAHTHVKMSLEFVTLAATTRSTYSSNSEDDSGLTCSICGKNVYDCICVEIVECGVCRKQPCICNENIENEEEKCPYCMYPLAYCYCNNSWGDQGGTSGPNPGGYPSTPSYPPGYNPGSGSGNGGTTTATPNLLLKAIGNISSTISGTNLENLNKCINEYYKNSCYKTLYGLLSEKKPEICFTIEKKYIKNVPVAAAFIREDNTVYFFSSDKITEYNITEEILHATQFHCFYGSSMGDYATGNIELEVKMARDIISRLTNGVYCSACGYIYDDMLSSNYDTWLVEGDYANYSEWYSKILPHFKYPDAKVDTSKVAHPMLDWLYDNIIITNQNK